MPHELIRLANLTQVFDGETVLDSINLYINTHGTSKVSMSDPEIAVKVSELFDMRPRSIEKRFGLRNPIYRATAAYGHVGRKPADTTFVSAIQRDKVERDVRQFAWEELDMVPVIREAFGIKD